MESTLRLVDEPQRPEPGLPLDGAGKRSRLRLYFLDLRTRYALAILLVGLIVIGTGLGKALVVAGVLWLGAALLLVTMRPSDQATDDLLADDLKLLVKQALRSLDDPEVMAAPLALFAPAEAAAQDHGAFVRRRVGPDGHTRAPIHRGIVIVPMADQLAIYSCRHDALRGDVTQIACAQHRYRDVLAVRLEEDLGAKSFVLELAGGRRLAVPVSAAWQEDDAGVAGPCSPGLEKTVRAIQALMREGR